MAIDLLIATFPGDELVQAAPLFCSDSVSEPEVLYAFEQPTNGENWFLSEQIWRALIDRLKDADLRRYRRVIVPSIHAAAPASILCAAVSTIGLPNLWMVSDSLHDEVVTISADGVTTLIDRFNVILERAGKVGHVGSQPFRTVVGIRKVASSEVTSYAAFLGLPNCPRFEWLYEAVDPEGDPWGLCGSSYESRRHGSEFELLDDVSWMSLVEVGACTGVFTRRLINAYSDRQIVAVENNELFLAQLRAMSDSSLNVFEGSIFDYKTTADVFVLSSCIYEMPAFPTHVFNLARTAILTSHRGDFERNVVAEICAAHGWRLHASREVPPAIEIYCGEPIMRDGSLANLWVR